MSIQNEWYKNEFVSHEMMKYHSPLENELSFYDDVANGNLEAVISNCNRHEFLNPEGRGQLSDNPIQNLRYHFIICIAMITRYCIHAGLEQAKAYEMSDFYCIKMDKCQTIDEISSLHTKMCTSICTMMKELHKQKVLSKPVILCIDYIYSHLHFRITVHQIAESLNLSESYLSKIFKKEMGIPVSQYIMQLKIEKAKNLLQYSDYNLVDIANYLAFSSQSHFIQSFQKYTGTTPHRFRTESFRSSWDKVTPL